MTIETISRILEKHSIPYFVSGSRIYADSMVGGTPLFSEVEDLTGYTRPQLLDWLGY